MQLAIEMQKRRCTLASEHGLHELYARALDEVALLLFSVADYPLAETTWNERLQQRLSLAPDPPDPCALEEKAQIVFQLARCCFVQGYLRMAGLRRRASQALITKTDHRAGALPESVPGCPVLYRVRVGGAVATGATSLPQVQSGPEQLARHRGGGQQ